MKSREKRRGGDQRHWDLVRGGGAECRGVHSRLRLRCRCRWNRIGIGIGRERRRRRCCWLGEEREGRKALGERAEGGDRNRGGG